MRYPGKVFYNLLPRMFMMIICYRDPLIMLPLVLILINALQKMPQGSMMKKARAKNSSNRGNLTMPHRTGSRPFRQVIWEDMGGKERADPPPISVVFKRTREKKYGNLGQAENAKYNEIIGVEKDNPKLSHFEVVEKCFGQQDRGSVACFGFGLMPKYVRGPLPSRIELKTRLQEKQRENDNLRKRMDEMEKLCQEELEKNYRKINSLEEKTNLS